jgi:hydrogenase maturation protein HypF
MTQALAPIFPASPPLVRRRWRLGGQVQGVGFRPFVYRAARQCGLTGWVRNDNVGVLIEVQGSTQGLAAFEDQLRHHAPALSHIGTWEETAVAAVESEGDFQIIDSAGAGADPLAAVAVDTAVCPECLREILDPAQRRHGYGLTNCTNCGPRYSIIRAVPYDRPNTTMAGFAMCPACRGEYADPADRRFHAQPIACPACGPKVELVTTDGTPLPGDPYRGAAHLLRAGRVVAIKGLGGFHLACDATNAAAVRLLRQRKQRDTKPFALMVRDLEWAGRLARVSEPAAALLRSAACPIVLCPRRAEAPVAPGVADGLHRLGLMLPYTPIHHLLLAADKGLNILVMTSANVSDEPLVIDNGDALQRLAGLCDALLWHDRPIERAVDDSVQLDLGRAALPLPIRRARGYVPQGICLPVQGRPGLAVGAELKSTVAVVREGQAILSHHLGDLTHAANYAVFRRAVEDMQRLMGVRPAWIARDLHPVYLSTTFASELAAELHIPEIPVQHHHAHAAAVLAEHHLTGPALAIICDGVGYGTDGQAWGGELLVADLERFERLAHLTPLPLAGGDAAARDTRRCGLALLQQALGPGFAEHELARRLVPDAAERQFLTQMLAGSVRCVPSTAMGRVFDGVAALLGVCLRNTHEAESGMKLEALAAAGAWVEGEPDYFAIHDRRPLVLDLAPLVRELVDRQLQGARVEDLAALFHRQVAAAWAALTTRAAVGTGLRAVALSGGVFCNAVLAQELSRRLRKAGLRVLRHRLVPPNDGGVSLGQAAVAAARMGDSV